MIVQFADGPAFAKVQSDPEVQGAINGMANNRDSAYDKITVSLNEEVEI